MDDSKHPFVDHATVSDVETTAGASDDETDYQRGRKEPINHGVKIRGKVKRGTGTRDQDELLLEGRGENAVEAANEFENALQAAEANNWAERLRDVQPEDSDDSNDD